LERFYNVRLICWFFGQIKNTCLFVIVNQLSTIGYSTGGTIKGCSLAREIGLHSASATTIVFMVIQDSGETKELLYYTIIQLVTNNSQNIASLPLRN
jgi:hypothetical protein